MEKNLVHVGPIMQPVTTGVPLIHIGPLQLTHYDCDKLFVSDHRNM